MEAIERAAFVSIGRGCGFAGLAVITLMLGLSFDPTLALRTGGYVGSTVTIFLVLLGLWAPVRPYRRTETWIILKKEFRPPAEVAQQVIGTQLQQTYYWFARRAGILSLSMIGISLVLRLFR